MRLGVGDTPSPTAFDALAGDYDRTFTRTTLGCLLRARVWATLADAFSPGDHVLELACGTGEDAVLLARRGIQVTATDGSAAMVSQAKAKAEMVDVADLITIQKCSLQEIIGGEFKQCPSSAIRHPFDGAFSNFGGLNTISDWRGLAASLSTLVKPGGMVILVLMGPVCAWEMAWYAGRGRFRTAFRRFGDSASAQVGEAVIPVWYPSAKKLRVDFSPWFEHVETASLGLWLPPSYLGHLVDRWPNFFAQLNRLEQATARLTTGWGDHYVSVFSRRK